MGAGLRNLELGLAAPSLAVMIFGKALGLSEMASFSIKNGMQGLLLVSCIHRPNILGFDYPQTENCIWIEYVQTFPTVTAP